MKKLINDPKRVVDESRGRVRPPRTPTSSASSSTRSIVVRADAPVAGKVGLVSGGGSGHEPLHAGFVGFGMLDAAVPGAVFTSPTPDPILAATQAVDGGAGVLHIVKNYTGDVLNFETAADLAGAEGIRCEPSSSNDDVAVKDSLYTAGRRGVAGTVLVEKIAGAAAERGDSLDAVAAVAEQRDRERAARWASRSPPCTVPHAGEPSFDARRRRDRDRHRHPRRAGPRAHPARAGRRDRRPAARRRSSTTCRSARRDGCCCFVNGMGGTPLVELYIVYRRAARGAGGAGRRRWPARSSATTSRRSRCRACRSRVLRLDDELTELWDAPVQTAALRWGR